MTQPAAAAAEALRRLERAGQEVARASEAITEAGASTLRRDQLSHVLGAISKLERALDDLHEIAEPF